MQKIRSSHEEKIWSSYIDYNFHTSTGVLRFVFKNPRVKKINFLWISKRIPASFSFGEKAWQLIKIYLNSLIFSGIVWANAIHFIHIENWHRICLWALESLPSFEVQHYTLYWPKDAKQTKKIRHKEKY